MALHNDPARMATLLGALDAGAGLEKVLDHDDDARLFMDCELASFVENRRHETIDPVALSDRERAHWMEKALSSSESIRDPRLSETEQALWIVERGERSGTLALSAHAGTYVHVWSLYVLPKHRGTGLGRRALEAINAAAIASGMSGVRISTDWTWQRAVRFYARLGMWSWGFKRSIDYVWARDLPEPTITVDGEAARLSVDWKGSPTTLIEAARLGDRLGWRETEAFAAMRTDKSTFELRAHAADTLAIRLALEGWPLLRSREQWTSALGSDLGGPEVLACKLACFERWARLQGFDVRTPHIPGLPYDEVERAFSGDRGRQ